MASTKEYRDFVIDNLSLLDDITYKMMMGEYLLYHKGILFGGIYDDRLLVKKVASNEKYELEDAIPYEHAKAMYLVDEIDNRELLKNIVIDTCRDLGDMS